MRTRFGLLIIVSGRTRSYDCNLVGLSEGRTHETWREPNSRVAVSNQGIPSELLEGSVSGERTGMVKQSHEIKKNTSSQRQLSARYPVSRSQRQGDSHKMLDQHNTVVRGK